MTPPSDKGFKPLVPRLFDVTSFECGVKPPHSKRYIGRKMNYNRRINVMDRSNKRKSALILLFSTLLIAWALIAVAQHPEKEGKKGPPEAYGIIMPEESKPLQGIAGSVSFQIPDEISIVEKLFVEKFKSQKKIKTVGRTVGGVRIVIFEDRGHNPWSTIQITGITGKPYCFIIVSGDIPASIDAHQ